MPFDPQRFPRPVAALLLPERVPDLGPGQPNRSVEPQLGALTPAILVGRHPLADAASARACLAGLWLYHDFLDESHTLSQDLTGPDGSYWHALMHRREPDPDNAKYWFRRVGMHPIFEPLAAAVRDNLSANGLLAAAQLGDARGWDPFRWVDTCETVRRGTHAQRMAPHQADALATACSQLGLVEWQLLFDYCFQKAVGQAT